MNHGINSTRLWNCTGGTNTIFPEAVIWDGVSQLLHVVQLGWDLVTMKIIVYDLHSFQTHQIIQWDFVLCEWRRCHPGRNHFHQERNASWRDKGDQSESCCVDMQGINGLTACQKNALYSITDPLGFPLIYYPSVTNPIFYKCTSPFPSPKSTQIR